MFNPELISYVEKVLNMGFSQEQIEKTMIEKGYDKKDAEQIIGEVLSKKKKINLFQKKVVDLGHDKILKKANPHVVSFIKKEFERGYFPYQIQRILVGEGYAKEMIAELVNILGRKHEKRKNFENLTEKISHLKVFSFSRVWIKDLSIVLVLLSLLASLFYFTNRTFSLFLMKIISFTIAVPLTALFMHKISKNEITYSESLRLILILGIIIFLVEIFSKSLLTLIALALIFYIFIHVVRKNYDVERKNAVLLALGVFAVGTVLIYLVLILLGFMSGVYGVLR